MKRVAGGAIGLLLVGGLAYFGAQTSSQRSSTAAARGLTCDVNITAPVRNRAAQVLVRSSDSLTVTVSGTAKRCPSSTVTVTRSENGAAETAVATPSTDGSGGWSQSITLTDGVSTKVFARMTSGGKTTSAFVIFDADTSRPKLAITAPAADGFGVLKIVAPHPSTGCNTGGNKHAFALEPGWIADTSCADGGQVATSVAITGAAGGYFDVSYGGVSVFDAGVTSSPQTFTPTLTLPDVTRANLVFSVSNDAGTTSITDLARVLTLVPPALAGPDGGTFVTRITDARRATVELDYVLPAVPANIDSASIELQWTTGMIIQDGGSLGWDGGGNLRADGGVFRNDSTLDIGVFVLGKQGGCSGESDCPHHPTLGFTKGLVYQMPNDCILYDPSRSPQIWECKGGQMLAAGAVRTAKFVGLPPLNTYYFWVVPSY